MNMGFDPLLKEIDDAVQHDRLMALWKLYRKPALVAAVALIVFTLGMSQWRQYQERVGGVMLQQFSAAQQQFSDEHYDAAASSFAAIAAQPRSGELADMAHLWQARALIAAQKQPAALPILQALAEHPQSSRHIWSDLACLRLAALDAAASSTCLASATTSPLAAERQLSQAAALWDAGKIDEARKMLSALAMDALASNTARSHAQSFLSVLPPPSAAADASPAIPETKK